MTVVHLRRPDRSSYELALRAGIGAGLALWLGTLIGLEDPYWGAISAVVATAGTLGASLGASFQRVLATTIALVIGLGFAALPPNGIVVSAVAVGVTYFAMMALSLEAGARLAAASTLIVTAIPGTDALDLALSRGLNVPIGCLVAVGVGLVVFPHRASTALMTGLRADVAQGLALTAEALRCYLGDRIGPAADEPQDPAALAARSTRLEATVAAHRGVLRDAAREPGSGRHLAALDRWLHADEALLDDARALVGLAIAGAGDGAPVLVAEELRALATAIDAVTISAGVAADDGAGLLRVRVALGALDDAFAAVRRRQGTVEYSTDEIARLLSVMRRVHGVGSTLERVSLADEENVRDGRRS